MLLKTFGCACFPLLHLYNQHKVSFRSSKCVFIGYSPFHKGCKCLHPSGRAYIARSVTFNEAEFPYESLFPVSSPSITNNRIIQHDMPFPTSPIIPQYNSTPQVQSPVSPAPNASSPGTHTSSLILNNEPESTSPQLHSPQSSIPTPSFIPITKLHIDLHVYPLP